jgi:hypothetical protein
VDWKSITLAEAIASGKRIVLLPQQSDGTSSGSPGAEPYRDPTIPADPEADPGHEE